jgi:hypothetical protein
MARCELERRIVKKTPAPRGGGVLAIQTIA